jgi:hypothetical protein
MTCGSAKKETSLAPHVTVGLDGRHSTRTYRECQITAQYIVFEAVIWSPAGPALCSASGHAVVLRTKGRHAPAADACAPQGYLLFIVVSLLEKLAQSSETMYLALLSTLRGQRVPQTL